MNESHAHTRGQHATITSGVLKLMHGQPRVDDVVVQYDLHVLGLLAIGIKKIMVLARTRPRTRSIEPPRVEHAWGDVAAAIQR